jgi:hypothetical protein
MSDKIYAVLTGDLVRSSKLSSDQSAQAMQWLRDAVGSFASMHPDSIHGEMDTFRHDSWQLLMTNPAYSVRAAVYLRASLKLHSEGKVKYDTRISIGVGEVEMIAEARISDSRGTAFTLSGKNLDAMERAYISCEVQGGEQAAAALLGGAVVPLLDCVVTDWTAREAYAIKGTLEGLTQEKVAAGLPPNARTGNPVTRQAVADSLERGFWPVVDDVLGNIEKSKLWGLL